MKKLICLIAVGLFSGSVLASDFYSQDGCHVSVSYNGTNPIYLNVMHERDKKRDDYPRQFQLRVEMEENNRVGKIQMVSTLLDDKPKKQRFYYQLLFKNGELLHVKEFQYRTRGKNQWKLDKNCTF